MNLLPFRKTIKLNILNCKVNFHLNRIYFESILQYRVMKRDKKSIVKHMVIINPNPVSYTVILGDMPNR
jgi:hypothetical protein